jgi:hypothetical protein
MRTIYVLFLSAAAVFFAWAATAQQSEKRIALVIGNAAYQAQPLTTAANDAGLIAQTLQAAGFDVVGARDLDQDTLRRSFRDFLDKATGSGPDTVAFIYFAGYGLQLEGENYLVPIDARIARDTDVAASALRASDYLRPLAADVADLSSGRRVDGPRGLLVRRSAREFPRGEFIRRARQIWRLCPIN